jgi:hypothetical protein
VGALPSGIAATAVAPSEASDFVARFATLEPLSEQDAGVPETMATQTANEFPQVHANRSRSAHRQMSAPAHTQPPTGLRIPQTKEKGAGLRRY